MSDHLPPPTDPKQSAAFEEFLKLTDEAMVEKPLPSEKKVSYGPDQVRVRVGDYSLTNMDLLHVCSLGPAVMAVVRERREQIEKHHHTPPLDLQYRYDELSWAALAYIDPVNGLRHWPFPSPTYRKSPVEDDPRASRIKDLTKGIALALADLQRLMTLQDHANAEH